MGATVSLRLTCVQPTQTSQTYPWAKMRGLVDDGLVRLVGLSNFDSGQIGDENEGTPPYPVSPTTHGQTRR